MIDQLLCVLRKSACRALLPPIFLNCVVALGVADRSGNEKWVASGFLYGERLNRDANQYAVFLVTARHVLDDLKSATAAGVMLGQPATSVVMRFNPEPGKSAREFPLPMEEWFVDDAASMHAAVAPVNIDFLREHGVRRLAFFEDDQSVADRAKATEIGLSEGDGVYVLGFPMGLVEQGQRNFVIVRGGTIARVQDCLVGDRPTFLIDAMVFPGNSGGPVVSRPSSGAVQGTKAQNVSYLIGMIEGYIPYEDYAVSAQTRRPRVIFEENSGLAEVTPVDEIERVVKGAIEKLPKSKSMP